MRISDWSSDVCSSDLEGAVAAIVLDHEEPHEQSRGEQGGQQGERPITEMNRRPGQRPQPDEGQEGNRDLDQAAGGAGVAIGCQKGDPLLHAGGGGLGGAGLASLSHVIVSVGFRSEEHTSDLQSLMRLSYAVSCLKKKT